MSKDLMAVFISLISGLVFGLWQESHFSGIWMFNIVLIWLYIKK